MAKSTSVRALVKDRNPAELRKVIVELWKLSKRNRQFLELHLKGPHRVDPTPVTEEGKQKFKACFHGRGQFSKINLSGARAAVRDYGKVLKEYPRQSLELKLYYVEVGTEITSDLGARNEGFYKSLESMFKSFCKDLKNHPGFYDDFFDRIDQLEWKAERIGRRFGDKVAYLADDLRKDLGED